MVKSFKDSFLMMSLEYELYHIENKNKSFIEHFNFLSEKAKIDFFNNRSKDLEGNFVRKVLSTERFETNLNSFDTINIKYNMEEIIKVGREAKTSVLGITLSYVDKITRRARYEFESNTELNLFG